jgi:hypothetical protein
MQKQEQKHTSMGVWSALSTGFDLTAKHPWLLLLPILVDVFIWIGPRLRFQAIIEQLVANLPPEAEMMEISQQLLEIGPLTNLFSVLSVPLIGVPALLTGLTPEKTPLPVMFLDVRTGGEWLALIFFLSLVGLFFTAVYYVTISSAVRKVRDGDEHATSSGWLAWIGGSWFRLLGLALLFFMLSLIIYIPISIMGALSFMINATLGTLVLLIAPFVLIWIIIYLSFAPPGITLNNRPLFQAVKESIQLVQGNLPIVLTLLLFTLLTGILLDWLLIMAENGTWLTIFNILIHAFVNTGFVAAFFVLYQNRAAAIVHSGNRPGDATF